MRRLASALVAAVIAAAALAGCSTSVNASTDDSGCGPYRSGHSSDAVTATGATGTQPKVSFPTPLKTSGSQVSLIRSGDGEQIQSGGVARIAVTLSAGQSGAVLQRAGYGSSSILLRDASDADSFDNSLVCRRVGDRYALTTTLKDAIGEAAAEQSGISPNATVVLVIDVRKAFLGKANGQNQLQDNALPQVVTAPTGQPGLVLPNSKPSTARTTWVVKQGAGAVLTKGTPAVVRFSVFSWESTASVSNDDSWTNPNSPAAVYKAGDTSSAAPFARALQGLRIGSQLMYVVPSGSGKASVFVVDIVGRL